MIEGMTVRNFLDAQRLLHVRLTAGITRGQAAGNRHY